MLFSVFSLPNNNDVLKNITSQQNDDMTSTSIEAAQITIRLETTTKSDSVLSAEYYESLKNAFKDNVMLSNSTTTLKP